MGEYRSTKDIAATVRQSLKTELPGWKFSVVVEHHTSIKVALVSGPEQIAEAYREHPEDWGVSTKTPYTLAKPFPGYAQLNHYQLLDKSPAQQTKRLTNGVYLTPKGWQVMRKAAQILAREHWDKSDIQTDYFCCAYYMRIDIGKWNKNYEVKP